MVNGKCIVNALFIGLAHTVVRDRGIRHRERTIMCLLLIYRIDIGTVFVHTVTVDKCSGRDVVVHIDLVPTTIVKVVGVSQGV